MHLGIQMRSIIPSASLMRTLTDGFFTTPVHAPLLAEEMEGILLFYLKG